MTDMTKRQAHFQAFGYEPRRMKPAHFASGFFIALTGQVYANEVLNKVAVIRAAKGLQEGYTAEDVFARLRTTGDRGVRGAGGCRTAARSGKRCREQR